MNDPERVHTPRLRMSLLDLMVIVLAAGLSAGMARGAKRVWEFFPEVLDRPAGIATMTLSIWICVPLARQILAFFRAYGHQRDRIWPISWRLFACIFMGLLAIEQGSNLRLGPPETWFSPMEPPGNPTPIHMRIGVLPILSGFIIAGTLAALSPTRETNKPGFRGMPIRWLLVPLVAIVGLLTMGLSSDIPYLVLIALDGVTNSFSSRSGRVLPDIMMRYAPSLNARMNQASCESLLALGACVLLGIFLSRDLRRDLSSQALSWGSLVPRFSLLAVCVFAFLRLTFYTIPMLHPGLHGGMLLTFERRDIVSLVAGFAIFGAGLAARAVTPRIPSPTILQNYRKFGRVVWSVLILSLTLLMVIDYGATTPTRDALAVPGLLQMILMMANFHQWIKKHMPGAILAVQYLNVIMLVWVIVLAWLAAKILTLNAIKPGADVVPMDLVGMSRVRLIWFLWCSSAMTGLCLTALPALALGGLAVEHWRFHGIWIFR